MTDYQIVSTSIFPSSLNFGHSAIVPMRIGDLTANSLVDSGSSGSLVTTNVVHQSGNKTCESFYKKLVSASGNQLYVMGRFF